MPGAGKTKQVRMLVKVTHSKKVLEKGTRQALPCELVDGVNGWIAKNYCEPYGGRPPDAALVHATEERGSK